MISMRVTKLFFDQKKIIRAMDRATRQALSKAGAFVRRTAKSSIRKRKRKSAPGEPPSSHTGKLRRFIFFAYEAQAQTVVIGPAKLTSVMSEGAAETLEHGGVSKIVRRRKGKPARKRVKIAARPFISISGLIPRSLLRRPSNSDTP